MLLFQPTEGFSGLRRKREHQCCATCSYHQLSHIHDILYTQAIHMPNVWVGGYCIARNFQERKAFTNFKVLWLLAKVFYMKFGGMAYFSSTSKQSVKVFSAKSYIFHQFAKVFSLESFRYTGYVHTQWVMCKHTDLPHTLKLNFAKTFTKIGFPFFTHLLTHTLLLGGWVCCALGLEGATDHA